MHMHTASGARRTRLARGAAAASVDTTLRAADTRQYAEHLVLLDPCQDFGIGKPFVLLAIELREDIQLHTAVGARHPGRVT